MDAVVVRTASNLFCPLHQLFSDCCMVIPWSSRVGLLWLATMQLSNVLDIVLCITYPNWASKRLNFPTWLWERRRLKELDSSGREGMRWNILHQVWLSVGVVVGESSSATHLYLHFVLRVAELTMSTCSMGGFTFDKAVVVPMKAFCQAISLVLGQLGCMCVAVRLWSWDRSSGFSTVCFGLCSLQGRSPRAPGSPMLVLSQGPQQAA